MEASLCESPLRTIEPFADLSPEELRSVEPYAHVQTVPRNGLLYMEGDPRDYVYCLVAGRIKLSRVSTAGKEFILELIEPGEIFGEGSLFADGPHDSFAIAFEDSDVVTLPSSEVVKLMQKQPDFLLELAKLVDLRKKRMEKRLATLALKKVRGRVASLLLQLCHDYGVRRSEGISLQIRLSHQEMANLIGVSRETVSHALSAFRRAGLINSDGPRLIVRQTLPLEQI